MSRQLGSLFLLECLSDCGDLVEPFKPIGASSAHPTAALFLSVLFVEEQSVLLENVKSALSASVSVHCREALLLMRNINERYQGLTHSFTVAERPSSSSLASSPPAALLSSALVWPTSHRGKDLVP